MSNCDKCYETKKQLKKANKGNQRLKEELELFKESAEEIEAILDIYKEALDDIINNDTDWCRERALEALEKGDEI